MDVHGDCYKKVNMQGVWTFKIEGYKIQVHANDVDSLPYFFPHSYS